MKTRTGLVRRIIFPAVVLLAAFRVSAADTAAPAVAKVREPAVAGLFYPKDAAVLTRTIDDCLAQARRTPFDGELKALICPHAGYEYSGPVAGSAFRLLTGLHFDTVIVLGPSHYADLNAASVTDAALFRTPLGDAPISPKAAALAQSAPFALNPPCDVERPGWYPQSSRKPPETDTADTWEHSVEVEIPFLQRTLQGFQLIPVVMGRVDPARAAAALDRFVDAHTLLIASSDLSHYYSYPTAQELDEHCIQAICNLDLDAMVTQQACGRIPIETVMHLARLHGWRACLLDARNSGDMTGERNRVVGYAAIAFYAPAPPLFSASDRHDLLDLARRTVRQVAAGGQLPEVAPGELAPRFTTPRGCFVTLTKHGELRGCIGYIRAQGPLYQAVIENARNAALNDPRFPAVSPDEVDQLRIEVSVLTEPRPLSFSSSAELLQKLRAHEDGVVLQIGNRSATFLPQVWDEIPDKVEFLSHLAMKAGCERTAWRLPGTAVFIYHVEAFNEAEESAAPVAR